MTQTLAIFYDAYRNLNAKKMFWVVLVISALVVVAFALVGINEKGVKIAFWQFDSDFFNTQFWPPDVFYKTFFLTLGIGIWLAWIATILALVSTAGIFPDLLNSGSIDLLVSKPMSRLRLFLTQYAGGLLFVTLQVTIFSLVSFLVIGFRGGVWEPGLFVAIPLTVLFFSYLFSVCVFLGLVTRSTVAALLLTLLFWFGVYGVTTVERTMLMFLTMQEEGVDFAKFQNPPPPDEASSDDKADDANQPTKAATEDQSDGAKPPEKATAKDQSDEAEPPEKATTEDQSGEAKPPDKDTAEDQPDEAKPPDKDTAKEQPDDARLPEKAAAEDQSDEDEKDEGSRALRIAHNVVLGVKNVLPKTTETIELLERTLISSADIPNQAQGPNQEQARVMQKMAQTLRERSVWWILGTSVIFEAVVLAWAAFIFCRRDF